MSTHSHPQWKQEISDRVTQRKLSIHVHYGTGRLSNPKELNKFDIVLTSYGTVVSEWPKEVKKRRKTQMDQFGQRLEVEEEAEEEGASLVVLRHMAGPLFRNPWHRVILDEAHTIKNKGTRTSKAVCQLESLYRWCLTGTPIQNNITELYSLLRFLDIPPYNDWTEWRTRIEQPFKSGRQKTALKRIQTVMTAICLRRRKTDQLDGAPLITLPDRNVHVDTHSFTTAEKEFYDAIEKRVQLQFNEYMRAGTVMKNYTNVLVFLLRLRQAT